MGNWKVLQKWLLRVCRIRRYWWIADVIRHARALEEVVGNMCILVFNIYIYIYISLLLLKGQLFTPLLLDCDAAIGYAVPSEEQRASHASEMEERKTKPQHTRQNPN